MRGFLRGAFFRRVPEQVGHTGPFLRRRSRGSGHQAARRKRPVPVALQQIESGDPEGQIRIFRREFDSGQRLPSGRVFRQQGKTSAVLLRDEFQLFFTGARQPFFMIRGSTK